MNNIDFLLQFIQQNLVVYLETRKTIFPFNDSFVYENGKKIDPKSSQIIDELKENLITNPIFLQTTQRNEQNEYLSFVIKYDQFREEFEFILLPTSYEIHELNEREKLRQRFFEKELSKRILTLTPHESVILINDVLGNDQLPWIKEFKLNPKLSDDEGIDFFAKICVDRNNLIEYDGYGKFEEFFGQLKHNETQPDKIRDFIGAMKIKRKKFGLFISSRGFTKRAMDAVHKSRSSIICEEISFISKLMLKHKIGLKKINSKPGYFIDEDWWDEIKKST